MKSPKFTSRQKDFLRKNEDLKDMVIGTMALDIDRFIKVSAGTPVKTGDMKAETRAFKARSNKWRVESAKVYSAVQEAGQRMSGPGAPTAKFENYTTAGTGPGWFARSIAAIFANRSSYITNAARALGLR